MITKEDLEKLQMGSFLEYVDAPTNKFRYYIYKVIWNYLLFDATDHEAGLCFVGEFDTKEEVIEALKEDLEHRQSS